MSETVWFTADTHFGHKNIVWLGNGRPWDSWEEMTEGLVENWNANVKRTDRIYHLGDFSFLPKPKTVELIKRLNGQIHMVRGNHDGGLDSLAPMFASYQQYKEIKVGAQRLVLFHFPMLSWHKVHSGSWHLHGHCHGLLKRSNGPMMDVGVDPNGYRPITYEEVAERLAEATWEAVDGH